MLTGFGGSVDQDGELDTVFLRGADFARQRPLEPDEHAVEGGRDAHRQRVIDHRVAGDQLVALILAAVVHLQRTLSTCSPVNQSINPN